MPTILMFENEQSTANFYRRIYENAGYAVVWFHHPPANVVEIISQEQPHLISMDITMPGMDGFAAARLLKTDQRTKNIPLFFMTNISHPEYRKQGLDIGASAYFVKGDDSAEQLVAKIGAILRR